MIKSQFLKEREISDVLLQMEKKDFTSTDLNNNILKILSSKAEKNNDIKCLQLTIDFSEVFECFNTSEKHESILKDNYCGYYDNGVFKEEFTCNVLSQFMYQKKIICCFTDFCDYTLDVDNNNNNCSITHSTLTILKPDKKGYYFAYQFNPHGRYQINETTYSRYITRKRSQIYNLNEILDVYVMSLFFKTMETEMDKECNFKIKILYNQSENHNYYGINLQSGDDFGCCFIFPFIVCYHLCLNIYETNYLENSKLKRKYRFPSFKNLLNKSKIDEMIYIIMSFYFKEFKYEVTDFYKEQDPELDYFYDKCEYILEKKGTKYIKYISEYMLKLIE